ncbi:hypothetical protein B0H19DRAFT_1375980 [Mycena capillaripes]|nr:hypothetical protein B0H19DRAFT_1375980 [Mycena capillaripes]
MQESAPAQDEYWLTIADVAALRNALARAVESGELQQPVDSELLQMDPLLQEAEQTKWDRLPLCAIAEAHKKEAERLIKRGSPEASADNNNAIFIEYFKYLQLYPYKNRPDYGLVIVAIKIAERVSLLRAHHPMQDEYWLTVADVTALRNALTHAVESGELQQPVDSELSQIDPLLQKAELTKWDRLPLCAIAEAHKKEAERLIKRGSPEASADYNNDIFIEYFKYLQLYPYKDSPDYVSDSYEPTV